MSGNVACVRQGVDVLPRVGHRATGDATDRGQIAELLVLGEGDTGRRPTAARFGAARSGAYGHRRRKGGHRRFFGQREAPVAVGADHSIRARCDATERAAALHVSPTPVPDGWPAALRWRDRARPSCQELGAPRLPPSTAHDPARPGRTLSGTLISVLSAMQSHLVVRR